MHLPEQCQDVSDFISRTQVDAEWAKSLRMGEAGVDASTIVAATVSNAWDPSASPLSEGVWIKGQLLTPRW